MTDIEKIQELYDRECIRQKIYTYTRAVDRIDEELVREVFTEDANADYGYDKGNALDVVGRILNMHRTYYSTSHQISNILLKIDGDKAASESYATCYVYFRNEQGEPIPSFTCTRYFDRWERRNGEWKIVDRTLAMDISNTFTAVQMPQYNTSRDKEDPSYKYLG